MIERASNTVWSRRFDEAIVLPDGRKLVASRDAGEYIAALSPKVHNEPQWQPAARALMLIAESNGDAMFGADGSDEGAAWRKEVAREPTRTADYEATANCFLVASFFVSRQREQSIWVRR
jgi:hypothetical protein